MRTAQKSLNAINDINNSNRENFDLETTVKRNTILIKDKEQKLNFYLLLYGLSLTNENKDLFELCAKKLKGKITSYPSKYQEASLSTDFAIRALLEFVLIACLSTSDVDQT